MAWVWLALKLFGHVEALPQAVSAVLGTGALLGLVLYLPLQLIVTGVGSGARIGARADVRPAAHRRFRARHRRIIKLATDTNLFTGIAVALTYFLIINTLLGVVRGVES